jgi:hypothetical protein
MSVVVPPIFTPIDTNELALNRPLSEETVRKLVQNVNMLGRLSLIGSIRAIAVNTGGVPQPSTDQFQYCDGGSIVNEASPLRATSGHDRKTPKLNDKYLRGAHTTITNDDTGDLNPGEFRTRNLSHTHTVGFVCTGIIGEEGNERHAYANLCHTHGMTDDLSAVDPIDLIHVQTAYYLKIN